MVKTAAELVAAANAAVETVSAQDAQYLLDNEDVVFVDVRETREVEQGKVPGAVHVPRGLLEFMADPASPMHNPALSSGKRLVVYCATGGRSALAAKTLQDMGIANPVNMLGGFAAWRTAGGDIAT